MPHITQKAAWRIAASLVAVLLPARAWSDEPAKLTLDERAARLEATAERFFKPLVERQWAHGLVVGVVDERGSRVFGFGRKSEKIADPPDGDSVFEIGSITKVFTGTLLADMAERGLVSIDDPVNKYLPSDLGQLQCAGREMRLVDLATHTSGLPRMPSNFAPKDAGDPFADYTTANLHDFLRTHAKPSLAKSLTSWFKGKSAQSWEYSNLGVGLLGTLLEGKAGRPYEELLLDRICLPLQMHSTRLNPTEEMTTRIVPGHDADGNPVKNWKFACLGPCGGLNSTANDMLKFVAANLELTDTPLKSALAKTHQPHYTSPDHRMGLNWLLLKADFTFHNGMTGGYNSFAGFLKSEKLGIVVLADTTIGGQSGLLDRVAVAFFKSLIEAKPREVPILYAAKTVDCAILEKYVGKYSLVPLVLTMTITSDEDRLYAQLTGQERFRIYPESETKFFYKVVDAQITFNRDASGHVEKLTLHQNGKDMPAARQPE